MKNRLTRWAAGLVGALVLGLAATAAAELPWSIDPSVQHTLSNCAANGSTTATLTAGYTSWLLTVTDEQVFVCFAASCAAGGHAVGVNTQLRLLVKGDVSCRSVGVTGDAIFTAMRPQ